MQNTPGRILPGNHRRSLPQADYFASCFGVLDPDERSPEEPQTPTSLSLGRQTSPTAPSSSIVISSLWIELRRRFSCCLFLCLCVRYTAPWLGARLREPFALSHMVPSWHSCEILPSASRCDFVFDSKDVPVRLIPDDVFSTHHPKNERIQDLHFALELIR